ncbi:1-phosphofructokinase [Zhaonella formicivorans]|uniref:1-phosphofructokinase n=1 Tax=Zhaonella formicivorans TaxID=2528593 RepID=UPI0010D02A7C|nr:1-phosphofructokinase [Zhaonella formicivorans]
MIATITLNPSVDICYYLDDLKIDDVNRTDSYIKTAGGKGINVSRVLKQLGCQVVATGFLGGGTGQFIETELRKMSVIPQFVHIAEDTRNCIAIIHSGKQTEILESGPNIAEEEAQAFIQQLADILDYNNIKVVAASGSLPSGLARDYYNKIIEITKSKGIKFALDTSGGSLKEAVKASPYLIKPNISELENLLDRKIKSEKELICALHELEKYQLEMVVVSLGKEGCIALCGNEIYKVTIPEVAVINPVGSGDAMLAGMLKEIANNGSFEEILKVGNTCGILNAMNEKTGAIALDKFVEIYSKIKIDPIK